MNRLPSSDEYDRMVSLNEEYNDMSYEDFVTMNNTLYNSLSQAEKDFVNKVISVTNHSQLYVSDMEHCVEMDASYVYFNMKGRLCVATGR